MSTDQPADLGAPMTGTEAPAEPTITTTSTINAADRIAAERAADSAMAQIKKQPTVKVRVPKTFGPQVVIINGARFNIPANVYVDVPEQVAGILRDAGRI